MFLNVCDSSSACVVINDAVFKAASYSSCWKGNNVYNGNRKEEGNAEGLRKCFDHLTLH